MSTARTADEAFYEVPGSRLRELRDAADDLTEAIRLLESALHLRMNGERAPGAPHDDPEAETWDRLWHDIEAFLRGRLDRAAGERMPG